MLLNGSLLDGVLDVDIHSNAHLAAARFRIRCALLPGSPLLSLQPGNLLDLRLSLGGAPNSVLQGEPDTVSIDPINRTVELDGRDLTARLLDARTQETFANQTASEIATTIANRHGLTPAVQATTTLAGRYYGNEHDHITLGQFSRATTEWDLVSFLAAREGFEVFVAGTTLTFAPRAQTSPAVTLTPGDCLSLSLERALTLARDLEVTVKSWNTRQQTAFTQTARSSATGHRSGTSQRIVVVRPNLSSSDALQLAQRILADLSSHERIVHAETPGELDLTARSQVQLTGTGTDFDGAYYVAELDRQFSQQHGFTQRLRLKNIDPNSASLTGDAASNG